METLIIKNNRTLKRLNDGHLWIFSNELIELPDLPNGTIVKVNDRNYNNLGIGFYNKNSLISIRLLFSDYFNSEIIYNRILNANKFRNKIFPTEKSYRLVFGESDLLPGLIIDKYSNYFSVQILSAGMELFKQQIVDSLLKIFPETAGIICRNDSHWRKIEGLNLEDEILFGTIEDLIIIKENDISYSISITKGQKTGYFFDQRLNRQFLSTISKDASVLDLFSNQGGFALNAAKGGAKEVLGVDVSVNAIEMAKSNSIDNNFSTAKFQTEDVFDFLNNEEVGKRKWDIIICDPPAFAKNKKSIYNALNAYRKVNKLAINCLKQDGILLTSSCSQHIDEFSFYNEIHNAAKEAGKNLIQFYRGNQSPDHPIIPSMKETDYLKFFGFIVR
jgi:23S rRNA (cytosine1962-C5)-methyltransferase